MIWYDAIREDFISLSIFFLNYLNDGSQNLIDVIVISSVLTTCFYFQPVLMLLSH